MQPFLNCVPSTAAIWPLIMPECSKSKRDGIECCNGGTGTAGGVRTEWNSRSAASDNDIAMRPSHKAAPAIGWNRR